ncbi:MAG: hypothetical protein U9N49_04970 [Campylobacterota bacterium]|nr:hypothetical protein [Campylobacterota bacterium]
MTKRVSIDSMTLTTHTNILNMLDEHREVILSEKLSFKEFKAFFKRAKVHHVSGCSGLWVVSTQMGAFIPIKRRTIEDHSQFYVEFNGLERSNLSLERKEAIRLLYEPLKHYALNKIDIALDYTEKPYKILKRLEDKRVNLLYYKNTRYFKSQSEGKKNGYFNLKYYDKAQKEGLDSSLYRIEFSFNLPYIGKNITLETMEQLYPKITQTIKRYTGVAVSITPL